MDVGRAQDLIHQVSPVRHEHESFRILVQPPDRIDPGRIIHHVHDIRGPVIVRSRADDPCRLVHRQQHRLLSRRILQRAHQFFLHRHLHARLHQRAQLRADAVHLHFSFFDQAVRLSPRAVSHGAEELVDPHRAVIPIHHITPIFQFFHTLHSECFAFLVLCRPGRFASWPPCANPQKTSGEQALRPAFEDLRRVLAIIRLYHFPGVVYNRNRAPLFGVCPTPDASAPRRNTMLPGRPSGPAPLRTLPRPEEQGNYTADLPFFRAASLPLSLCTKWLRETSLLRVLSSAFTADIH